MFSEILRFAHNPISSTPVCSSPSLSQETRFGPRCVLAGMLSAPQIPPLFHFQTNNNHLLPCLWDSSSPPRQHKKEHKYRSNCHVWIPPQAPPQRTPTPNPPPQRFLRRSRFTKIGLLGLCPEDGPHSQIWGGGLTQAVTERLHGCCHSLLFSSYMSSLLIFGSGQFWPKFREAKITGPCAYVSMEPFVFQPLPKS